jgi:hypothetical protein
MFNDEIFFGQNYLHSGNVNSSKVREILPTNYKRLLQIRRRLFTTINEAMVFLEIFNNLFSSTCRPINFF